MLRGELENELATSRRSTSPHTRNYRYIEQVFKVPLWYIETLSVENSNEPGQLWNRYIASSPIAALEAIQEHGSLKSIVHVLLPGYMMQQSEPILTRCQQLWRCHVIEDPTHEAISFVTDHGEFVDCQEAVEINELEKIELVWTP